MRILSLFAVASLCSLTGCSSSSSTPEQLDDSDDSGTTGATQEVPDPCALLSIAEVAPITEAPAVTAEPNKAGSDRSCLWKDASGMHLFTIHASILDTKFRPLAQYYAWISGVGEQAYKSSNGAIFVKVGQIKFMSEAFWPVKDGVVGPEVTAAISADGGEGASLAVYETSFRLAKLFAAKLQ